MSPAHPITCEILAPSAIDAVALRAIAEACARDTGQPLTVKPVPLDAPMKEAALTLLLPVDLASSQHQVWCLACRLACFCPQARVSVLVLGAGSFAPSPDRRLGQHCA
jgi:hypothetical protein